MKIMKAMVIGGAGFIGSHLVDVCLQNDVQVAVYDNFSTGKKGFLPTVPELQITEGDILDSRQLSETIAQFNPDVVFHLAAIHHIPTCEKMPLQALRVNIEGTESVLNACAENRISRLVFTSTGGIYDPRTIGPLNENSPIKATDIYTISKSTCENLISYYVTKKDQQAIIARLFNAVGCRETNSHVIPAIMSQLVLGLRQIKLGNLSPRRDYIHVLDIAEALFSLGSMNSQKPYDVFNVGSGIENSVQDVVDLFAEENGEPIEIISSPELQRKVDRPTQQADISKISIAAGWVPSRNLRQALSEIWKENKMGQN